MIYIKYDDYKEKCINDELNLNYATIMEGDIPDDEIESSSKRNKHFMFIKFNWYPQELNICVNQEYYKEHRYHINSYMVFL